MNLFGEQSVFTSSDGTSPIAAKFFGHSSFANLSIVKESTVLPARDLVKGEEELKLFAPLGCGIQTGVGAILNLVKPGPEDRVMVCGLGGVGLSAVMVSSSIIPKGTCEIVLLIIVDVTGSAHRRLQTNYRGG